jgi:hypothetical protein
MLSAMINYHCNENEIQVPLSCKADDLAVPYILHPCERMDASIFHISRGLLLMVL